MSEANVRINELVVRVGSPHGELATGKWRDFEINALGLSGGTTVFWELGSGEEHVWARTPEGDVDLPIQEIQTRDEAVDLITEDGARRTARWVVSFAVAQGLAELE